jgi:hypothetical protein
MRYANPYIEASLTLLAHQDREVVRALGRVLGEPDAGSAAHRALEVSGCSEAEAMANQAHWVWECWDPAVPESLDLVTVDDVASGLSPV